MVCVVHWWVTCGAMVDVMVAVSLFACWRCWRKKRERIGVTRGRRQKKVSGTFVSIKLPLESARSKMGSVEGKGPIW